MFFLLFCSSLWVDVFVAFLNMLAAAALWGRPCFLGLEFGLLHVEIPWSNSGL